MVIGSRPMQHAMAGDERAGRPIAVACSPATGTIDRVVARFRGAFTGQSLLQIAQNLFADPVKGLFNLVEGSVVIGKVLFYLLAETLGDLFDQGLAVGIRRHGFL